MKNVKIRISVEGRPVVVIEETFKNSAHLENLEHRVREVVSDINGELKCERLTEDGRCSEEGDKCKYSLVDEKDLVRVRPEAKKECVGFREEM